MGKGDKKGEDNKEEGLREGSYKCKALNLGHLYEGCSEKF